ncbi:hypothetical protein DXG03_007462 [Asterophora parasitica]|uniref:High affinity methionine permease n=1 Tax=Asterophora parasitica TaxID=117018 RepID=A0A9P7KDJ5_9AGAR|nr:hypothetical protein DXG03_007462 [Asterophora parasitica]
MSLRELGERVDNYGSITTPLLDRVVDLDDDSDGIKRIGEDGASEVEGKSGGRRQIGVVSAIFIIFNRMIGTGIFATPSTILIHSGSVGMSLIMWLVGAVIAAVGMQVYITWGTASPQNGGEKNYLEYVFRKPRHLMTSVYATITVLLGWSIGNSLVFGEYLLKALGIEPSRWILRFVALACLTFAMLIHGTALKWGLRLQNFLGMFKMILILIVVGTGFVALSGHMQIEKPHNFENIFEGTTTNASSLCFALYNVLWSFIGFSNVNYALAEVKNPARTIRIAGPFAIVVVTVLYMLANIAYFAGASKEEITGSGRLVAALLFRNVYGRQTERLLDSFVALCALGNVLAVIFSLGRVNQELGREGILPFSKLWASNRPFNAPLAGLALRESQYTLRRAHGDMTDEIFVLMPDWAACIVPMFALPPGDAYNFVLNVTSYPLSVINAAISFGIIYLSRWRPYADWPHVGTGAQLSAAAFGLANIFLFIVPLMRPPPNGEPYEHLPYWSHAVGGWAVFGLGFLYWLVWAVVLPFIGNYGWMKTEETGSDGLVRHIWEAPKFVF